MAVARIEFEGLRTLSEIRQAIAIVEYAGFDDDAEAASPTSGLVGARFSVELPLAELGWPSAEAVSS